ncbi:protein translocase subunit SecD [Endothiovibrio diazotrophicus]
MINQYPLWKYLLLAAILVVGGLYALPNLYGEDPAIQVSPARGATLDETVRDRIDRTLEMAGVAVKAVEVGEEGKLLYRFHDTESQLKAADVVGSDLGTGYTVALNLAPSTPQWLRSLDAAPMFLGLDLRGGVHFLMEVDMDAAVKQAEERYVGDVRTLLRNEKVRYLGVSRGKGGVVVTFRNAEDLAAGRSLISRELGDLELTEGSIDGSFEVVGRIKEAEQKAIRKFALEQNITTLRNRVNELGVSEPVIQQQGQSRIVVQLPGVQDTARAKEILGATATLEFRLVSDDHSPAEAAGGRAPAGTRLYHDRQGRPVLLEKRVLLTGDYITDAASGIEQQSGGPAVFITLDGKGARLMTNGTKDNVGRMMAVVFIENKVDTKMVDGKPVKVKRVVEEVINQAVIRERLGKRFQISGLDSTREARDLALLLRAGSLAAPIEIVEERTVGPSLGKENIEQGFLSVVVGMLAVLVFMAIYYKAFGLVADLALVVNLVLIVAVLSIFQATLTLPGIAGIVLTVGMAVDANVLIFERIREELKIGNSPQAAIHAGYEKAFSTIADANITTLIAALVLFSFGTGPIKGFAVTLSIGIATSMFTAIMGTRAVVNLLYGGRRVQRLAI